MNERQTQIAKSAIPLFLSEGVGVSTARIAKAAGVSNGTLFNAFPTKQDLIDAIYRKTKLDMLAAFGEPSSARLTRAGLQQRWLAYLNWAQNALHDHKVMHLLKQSGLTSAEADAEIEALFAPHVMHLQEALNQGDIQGPNVAYIGALIFAQIDLVIDHNLSEMEAEIAFDMLCNAIGLKE